METKEIKNWEWIKSVEVQYMGFLTRRAIGTRKGEQET